MQTGHFALLLHAHLPFVRHPEYEDFLEEEWLFEAVAETYVPLLKVFFQLVEEEIPFRVTMSLTPTLCAMLRDPLLQSRTVRYLERGIAISRKEIERTSQQPELQELARFYLSRFLEARELYVEKWHCDLLKAFSTLAQAGCLELIASAATHGFLPLMESVPEAMRAQIRIGIDEHLECFGTYPKGFWLPECGYVPAIDPLLQETKLRWFIVDSHGVIYGKPRPRLAIFSPYYTTSGTALFARDRESSKQIWCAREGYPAYRAYREFYRDIAQDLPVEVLKDYLPLQEGSLRTTGLKYHRITGGAKKDLYRRSWAMAAANSHAQNFVSNRIQQIESLKSLHFFSAGAPPPIVLSPFDAELFGHWWFEGPEFLDLVLRKSAFHQKSYRLSTPSEYLDLHPTHQILAPSASSWGNHGYSEVWLNEDNAWIYPHLHRAARQMVETAHHFQNTATTNDERILRQMARELLLVQSSDWAFLMKTGTARNYSTLRTQTHLRRFTQLYENLKNGRDDSPFLQECEQCDNLFPHLNWRHYLPVAI